MSRRQNHDHYCKGLGRRLCSLWGGYTRPCPRKCCLLTLSSRYTRGRGEQYMHCMCAGFCRLCWMWAGPGLRRSAVVKMLGLR